MDSQSAKQGGEAESSDGLPNGEKEAEGAVWPNRKEWEVRRERGNGKVYIGG